MLIFPTFLRQFQKKQEEPKENEIEVLQKQIATLKPEDLKVLAQKKSTEILSKIQRVSSNIDRARDLTREAENATSSWWNPFAESKAEKRSKLNTKANAMQNEAMAEMNTLIQESIKLTTMSYGFAQAMAQTLAAMLKNGFKDKDGDIQKLHGIAKEQALVMLDEAQKFVKHQREYEERQERQEEQIFVLQSDIAEHKEEYEKRQERQERDISTHRQRIQKLHEQLESKKYIDEEQQAQINKLQNRVQYLKASDGKTSLIVSIIALLVGIGSIALQFLR